MTLVLLDIDGTLIGPDGDVSDAVWEAATALRDEGARLAVCTGRTHAGVALRIAERLDAEAPHIFHNGALVCTAGRRVLSSTPLSKVSLRHLVDHARKLGATLELYTTSTIFVDEITPECATHADVLDIAPVERDLDEVIEVEEVIRAHWIVDRDTIDDALALELDDASVSTATSPALPDSVFASVTEKSTDKGTGAVFAARHLGVELEDVVGVGDSEGDIPLLEAVGHPFAMGDGHSALAERFRTLGSVESDGVLEALDYARDLTRRAHS